MKLLKKTLIDLSDSNNKDRLGHISKYELSDGTLYYVYFLEARYFGFKHAYKNGKKIKEERAIPEYHYSIDLMFEDKDRRLGWENI